MKLCDDAAVCPVFSQLRPASCRYKFSGALLACLHKLAQKEGALTG